LFILILFTTALFSFGVFSGNLINADSDIYKLTADSIETNVTSFSHLEKNEKLIVLAENYSEEIKYVLFAFVASFSIYSGKMCVILCSFKGLISGYCSSVAINSIRSGNIPSQYPFLSCVFITFSCVAYLVMLAVFCMICVDFSQKALNGFSFKKIIKKRSFYIHVLNFVCMCGICALILFIRYINCVYLIS